MASEKSNTDKDKFREEVKRLKEAFGVKYKAIGKPFDLQDHNVAQIVNNRAFKYEDGMLEKLYEEFPQLGVKSLGEYTKDKTEEFFGRINDQLEEMNEIDLRRIKVINDYLDKIKELKEDKEALKKEKDQALRILENITKSK